MTLKTLPLSALCPAKDNPRRSFDKDAIVSLAESIKTDGVLQNLVVEPDGDGRFRVVSGTRRLLALKLLKRQGSIDGEYKVPVEVRKGLENGDALRIATVENVQRVALDPVDEAEAFAAMLQQGAAIEDVAAKTGLSEQTIRRRLAISNLCDEAKASIRSDELSLAIAEAMTLGTHEQQRSILKDLKGGTELDRDAVREMLLSEKPSVSFAIFPLEKYTGTFTRDLFGGEDTTYFDDAEQFLALQKEAVEGLAEKHRKKAPWVDVYNVYGVPWWQYREAKKLEHGGVVINLKPSGRVEIKKDLMRHEVKQEVVETTRETPEAPKERPAVGKGLVRYAACQKSVAVQAALLDDSRKAKELAVTYLLLGFEPNRSLRIDAHPSVMECGAFQPAPKALLRSRSEASLLLEKVGMVLDERSGMPTGAGTTELELYEAVKKLSSEELERLSTLLVVLSFGQRSIDELDVEESLFNRVAADLNVAMRDWWIPDARFLDLLRKEQLELVAIESGASIRLGKLNGYAKKELVSALVKHFERTAAFDAVLDEHDTKGRSWVPGAMHFPAQRAATMADPV
jgi:ParB family chromosome partitioning protein